MNFISVFPYNISFAFIALSILAMYHRISVPGTLFRKSVVWVALFVCAKSLALLLLTVFRCHPVTKLFEPPRQGTSVKCMSNKSYYLSMAVVKMATTFWVYILPIPHLWTLQMSMQKRILLIALFALGSLSCIANIVRLGVTADWTIRYPDNAECKFSVIY